VLAAAVVPHPPALVPALAAGGAAALAPLLAACDAAVESLLEQAPRTVVCVGPGPRTVRHNRGAWGTLAGFGVAVETPGEPDRPAPELPLSLTIGRWLLERAGWTGELVLQQVAPDLPAAEAAALGRGLAADAGPATVWLVLGDGSIRRGPRAPGHDDPRSEGFDAEVGRAFAAADLDALLDLDAGLAAELGAAGRAAWQVLAGAAQSGDGQPGNGQPGDGQPGDGQGKPIEAALTYQAAPFGVGYLVAQWRLGS
jgi:hypothetical protein